MLKSKSTDTGRSTVFTDEFEKIQHIDVLILNSTISFRAKLSEHYTIWRFSANNALNFEENLKTILKS